MIAILSVSFFFFFFFFHFWLTLNKVCTRSFQNEPERVISVSLTHTRHTHQASQVSWIHTTLGLVLKSLILIVHTVLLVA